MEKFEKKTEKETGKGNFLNWNEDKLEWKEMCGKSNRTQFYVTEDRQSYCSLKFT